VERGSWQEVGSAEATPPGTTQAGVPSYVRGAKRAMLRAPGEGKKKGYASGARDSYSRSELVSTTGLSETQAERVIARLVEALGRVVSGVWARGERPTST
jgi:hypothetical protein